MHDQTARTVPQLNVTVFCGGNTPGKPPSITLSLFEQLQIGVEHIHFSPFATGNFFQYAELFQVGHQLVRRRR